MDIKYWVNNSTILLTTIAFQNDLLKTWTVLDDMLSTCYVRWIVLLPALILKSFLHIIVYFKTPHDKFNALHNNFWVVPIS